MAIAQWQKNELFKAIESAGLEPSHFSLVATEGRNDVLGFSLLRRVRPTYELSGSLYGGETWYVKFTPLVFGEGERSRRAGTWYGVMELAASWLQVVKQDANEPDLWAEVEGFAQQVLPSGLASVVSDEPMTTPQYAQLCAQLDSIAEAVQEKCVLSEPALGQFRQDLADLKEQAKVQGRRSILFQLLGLLLAVALSLSEDFRATLTAIVHSAFVEIIGFLSQ